MRENRIYGYCSISTNTQKIKCQEKNIKKIFPDAVIIAENCTKQKAEYPKFQCLLKTVRPGDTIVFNEISRMSRDAETGFELYQKLYRSGVRLVFLKERHLDTDVYQKAEKRQNAEDKMPDIYEKAANQTLMLMAKLQIELAFESAQEEIELIRKRTREGILQAKIDGKSIGRIKGRKYPPRKKAEAKRIILKNSKSFGGSSSDAEVMILANVSHNTYYKYKKELRETKGSH